MTKTTPAAPIPLVDLNLQHRRIADEVRAGFERVIAASSFILGPEADLFEREFADYCGVAHCVGVGNGTDAIELALRACRVGAGDEVILPANTFVATAEAVIRAGAAPVVVDCDEDFLLDVDAVSAAVTSRTRAVIPVHLYGQLAPMKALADVLPSDVVVIEDAAQAHGAAHAGQRAGSFGIAAATSFYPGKNLGAYGDAGAVLTDDHEVADRLRRLRSHGGMHKYEHVDIGFNSRLDGLQAVVLSAKLARLDAWNDERRAAATRYDQLLADLPDVIRPRVVPGNDHVWHLYVVRVPHRDEVLAALHAAGIGASVHYPAPVHLLPAFENFGYQRGTFPVSEHTADRILSLPIYPGITEEKQKLVIRALRDALKEASW
jgi:dTDP-4-amino-4,6-dideoxygalactose transaminase